MLRSALLNVMIKAARKAARGLKRDYGEVEQLQVSLKGPANFVSAADRRAEQVLREELLAARPGYCFIGEEGGRVEGPDKSHTWLVDPLDGTTNFLHGFPQYAVSIALEHRGIVTQGVVYDPAHNDLFTASRGRGAFLNDARIRVSKRLQLKPSLIGTGFPFKELAHLDAYTAMLVDMMKSTAGVRRAGSATLDLAYVAAGRLDGFWEMGLGPWDMAAGSLLVTEAGGLVGDFEGNEGWMETGNIAAGSPKVFGEMLQLIAPHLTPQLKTRRAARSVEKK